MNIHNFIRILSLAFFAAVLFAVMPDSKAHADGTAYYVSQSEGSDSNNGTSPSTPWKTLAKASTMIYQPGDRLLLKSGDTWDEQLTLLGNGTAGSVITVSAYGTGNRPLIERSNYHFNGDIGIYMKDPSHWKISNLDFRQVWNGIMIEFETGLNRDVTIENVGFFDSPYAEYDPNYWPQKAARGFYTYVGPGNAPLNPVMDGLTFRNIHARNMGGGIHWEFGGVGNKGYAYKNVNVFDSVFEDGLFIQLSFLNTDTGSMKNVKFFNNGMTVNNGPANFVMYDDKNIQVSDVESAFNRRENSPIDGDGFELNNCHDCKFERFLVHHNSLLAMLSGGDPDQNSTFDNTVFYNNAVNVFPPPYQPIEIYPFWHGSFLFHNSRIYPGPGALYATLNKDSIVLKDSFVGDINPGSLRIGVQPGELFESSNTSKNMLLRNAPDGDWTMTTKLSFNPNAGNQQAGLIVYQDDDHYLKLVRGYTSANILAFQQESGGVFQDTYAVPGITATTLYLKIAKSGTTYAAYYNTDGSETWTLLHQTTIGLKDIRIGLVSFGGPAGLQADFDWFDIKEQ